MVYYIRETETTDIYTLTLHAALPMLSERRVGEAVTDYRAQLAGEEPPAEPADVRVDLPVDAHLPHDYVPGERLRMEAYRKVASVQADEQAQAVLDELTDRYGAPPAPVLNLLAVARFRAAVRQWGITEVSMPEIGRAHV